MTAAPVKAYARFLLPTREQIAEFLNKVKLAERGNPVGASLSFFVIEYGLGKGDASQA